MAEVLEKIIYNVLTAIYESTAFSLCLAFFFMYFYLEAKDHGVKKTVLRWKEEFKNSPAFKKVFLFAFYLSLLLFRTLFNREIWIHPLRDIMGGWSFYSSNGQLSGENIENIALFVPYAFLLLFTFESKIHEWSRKGYLFIKTVLFTFIFSCCIEFAQMFFSLGTFQFSDMVFNTLGGFIGATLYMLVYKKIKRS